MEANRLNSLQNHAIKMKPQNGVAGSHLFLEFLLSVTALLLSSQESFLLWLPGQLMLFMCIWRWFSILHSCAHGAFFSSAKLNTSTGQIASVFSLVPYGPWKESHIQHHRWTGVEEKDPSLPRIHEPLPGRTQHFLDFCWKYYIPVFSVIFLFVKKTNLENPKKYFRGHVVELAPYLIHLALMVLLKGLYFQLFGLAFLLYLISSDIVVLSQHAMIPMQKISSSKAVPASKQDQYTRTLAYPKWVSALVLLYFDKHTLHHLVPYVPHYSLGRLQEWSDNEVPWSTWLREVKKQPGHKVYFE